MIAFGPFTAKYGPIHVDVDDSSNAGSVDQVFLYAIERARLV